MITRTRSRGATITDEDGKSWDATLYALAADPATRPLVTIGGDLAMGRDKYGDARGAVYGEPDVNVEVRVDLDEPVRYYVNLDRREFVDLQACNGFRQRWDTSGDEWTVHPLPLLTCEGNGRGGGDYYSAHYEGGTTRYDRMPGDRYIGAWARDRVQATTIAPGASFCELVPGFSEGEEAIEAANAAEPAGL